MKFFSTLFLLIIFPVLLFSQGTSVDSVSFSPNKNPELVVKKVPNGSIIVDGELNESVWLNAPVAQNFTEISPGDNVKPQVDTKGYVLYDDENIYFGFICYDDMKTLRATLCDRDKMFSDDWVGPFIDTYNDQKQAFEFYTNPYGVQGDLIWTPGNENSSQDFIYTTEAKIHQDRWVAEMKIPFKSLRFPQIKEQMWRVHIIRNRYRDNRQEIYWSSVSRDNPNFLGQAGIIRGMYNIKSGNNLEILPYVIRNNTSTLESPRTSNSSLNDSLAGDFGFSLKYGLTSNLTLDATYNPDFSQVEADAPQIDVNSSSALFFDERRPFFLEGNNIFNQSVTTVYTRSIVNPLFASKLTGKIGKWNIGFLSAYDENTPFLIPQEEGSTVRASTKNSLASVIRARYDLSGENYIGFMLTDREYTNDNDKKFSLDFSGHNRVGVIDYKFNFLDNFYFGGQILGYDTKELNDTVFYNNKNTFNDGKNTYRFDGESFSGFGNYMWLSREGRNWGFYTEYNYQPAAARRDVGFTSRNNFHIGYAEPYGSYYPEGTIFQRIGGYVANYFRFNTGGYRKERYIRPGFNLTFRNGFFVWANLLPFNEEVYGNVEHKNVTRWDLGIENNTAFKHISGGMWYQRGRFIVRFANPSYVGEGQNIEVWSTIKPLENLTNSISYFYQDLAKEFGGEMLYSGWVLSNRTTYQFNKNLFARLLVQYDSFNNSIGIDPLISYKWNPFTVLYLGSTHSFNEVEDMNQFGRTTLKESDRIIFLKFQYLWQL